MRDVVHRWESSLRSVSGFRSVVDALPLGVAVFRQRAVLYANPALSEILGYGGPEAVLDVNVDRLFSAETWRGLEPMLDAISSGVEPVLRSEGRLCCRDHRLVSVDMTLLTVPFDGGDATLLVSGTPLEERADSRRALGDRMASLGRLAAGVAHEINNPLAYVLGSLELAAQQLRRLEQRVGPALAPSEIAELGSSLANARVGAERVRSVVKDLMAFSRSSHESRELVDVEAVLDSMVNLAWNEIRHRARLVKTYAGVPPVSADKARLGQVFLNLLLNASQAIDEGAADASEIALSTRHEHGRVIVEVRDSGKGIRPEDIERVFDPFFTTKPVGSGTGLGLAICQSIVRGLGGEVGVQSKPGRGATFFVSLPIAAQHREALEEPPPVSRRTVVRRSRILVVDDEPLLGQTLRLAFQGRHEVDVVTSGREAIAQLARDSAYDLVLCDLMMPDVSGSAVFEAVERSYPNLVSRFVFMTGGAFTERAQEFLAKFRGAHLEKPFNIEDVEKFIQKT